MLRGILQFAILWVGTQFAKNYNKRHFHFLQIVYAMESGGGFANKFVIRILDWQIDPFEDSIFQYSWE